MIEILQQRPDLTALLDVTYPEPPQPGSPLFTLPNVVLSPHIAGAMNGEVKKMGQLMVDEFQRWNRGEPMLYEIDQEQARRLA
jgi:phosphoglycerate dehydrogenase-like enzyme